MKTPFRFPPVTILLAALALAPAPAPAGLFDGGEKARLLEKADAEYAAAKEAARQYQVVTQMTELRKAQSTYRQLATQYPDYEARKVADRYREVSYTLGSIEEKARRGEIVLPAEELSGAAQGAPPAASEAADGKKPTAPAAPAFRRPIPELVRTGDVRPAPDAGGVPAPAAADPWLREATPNPLAPRRNGARAAAGFPPSGPVALPAAEDAARLSRFASMIRDGRASNAVLELEDVLAEEGASASVGTRLMFVRALFACGNYDRGADELKAVPASADDDPAVLSLRVAAAVAQDDVPRALLLLDRFVTMFPDFSDAYVDLAYVRFLSDPGSPEAREEAVTYYKQALMRGAKRDPRLEAELDLRVE